MKNSILYTLLLAALAFAGTGCETSRYPAGKPYVYKTKINIVGQYKEDEKKRLEKQLEKQLDDSLQLSKEQKKALRFIPYYQKVYHEFDTSSISRTINFFRYAYVANGYFRGGTTTYKLDTLNAKTGRLALNFYVRPHKNHRIDTVIYDIQDTVLQELAMRHRDASVIRKGDLYTQELLNAERNRLAGLYRNNGYFRINRDNFKVLADTINRSLFVFTTDPLEQAALVYEASKFDENPTTSVTFTLNTPVDSSRLKQYYVGNVEIYPDNADRDTLPPNSEQVNDYITKRYFDNNYKNKIFPPQIYLKKGSLYRQSDYDKTYNALNYLGAWQQVNIAPRDSLRNDTADFNIFMLPYRKYQGERRLEGSYNQNNGAGNTQTGNLWGVNISQLVKNRNLAREAIQTTFEARAGIEFRGKNPNDVNTSGQQFINAGEFSLTYDMLFPKFLPNRQQPAKHFKKFWKQLSVPKTLLSINSKFTERFKFFRLAEVNLSHSYLFKYRDDYNISISALNVERKFLVSTDSLNDRIARYPILAFIFNDGFILGPKFSISRSVPPKNRDKRSVTGTWRFSFENSGLPVSFIPLKEFKNNLFSFAKLEFDRRWNIEKGKNSWAFRTYAGLGIPYRMGNRYNLGSDANRNIHLPFFKQFTAGGPNSMRAWGVRNLNSYSTRTNTPEVADYYGDIQAEVNTEFRFLLFRGIFGIPVKSAFFIDAGNIWNMKPYDQSLVPPGMGTFDKIYNDIAVAGGTSVRLDFDYFLIRLDFGLKLKTPLDISGNGGWFDKDGINFKRDGLRTIKMQLGINYPF